MLVPFDGSEFSKKALERSIALAGEEGGRITVLYVIPRYEEMMEFFRTDAIRASMKAEAEKVIDGARDVSRGMGFVIGTAVREGHAADEIVAAAGELGADLIAMGTSGWRGVNRAIMGSTTNSVVSHASCPVLVVK